MDTQRKVGSGIPVGMARGKCRRGIRRNMILLAGALGAAFAATEAPAAPATMRTVLRFSMSAWVSPAAVVLRSPDEWTRWNNQMAESERAVAPEPLPTGVDWNHEVLLVVALGEFTSFTTFELDPPVKSGHSLYFTGRIEPSWTQTFSSPAHVVAVDRRYADSIELDPAIGVLEDPFGLPARRKAAEPGEILAVTGRLELAGPAVPATASSWGALKHRFR